MSVEIDNLIAQVASNDVVLNSATALINGIADRITAAGGDPVKLAALTTELKAQDDVLAAAVVANTPAAPFVPNPPVTAGSSNPPVGNVTSSGYVTYPATA
jgi:hypothetical protein